jgi:hypothetical protein
MMLKTANNEYIQVDDVEVERQAKLFQHIGDTAGDFSYEFEIDANSDNLNKLGIISPVDGFQKTIYTVSDISLLDDEGAVLYSGFIRVQSIQETISVSFFSGNNNWFSSMSGDIADLDLSALELEINTTTIPASWVNTSGIIFPFVDLGAISRRATNNWKLEDFQPFIYIHTAVSECFKQSGLKLAGEILTDWRYNHMTTANGTENTKEIDDRKVSIASSVSQGAGNPLAVVLEFDQVTGVYYPGLLWDTVNDRFVADSKMVIDLGFSGVASVGSGGLLVVDIYINGSFYKVITFTSVGASQTITGNVKGVPLQSGDILTIRIRKSPLLSTVTVDTAKLTITPTKLYKVFARNLLPNISQVDFVNEVFTLFNTVVDYDPFTKTVTVDFFKSVIKNDELDLSEYIDPSTISVNYTELMESYGKQNILKYNDPSSESIEKYNEDKPIPYGAGSIQSNNDFAEDSVDIVESVFCASDMSSLNPLSVNLPRMDFRQDDEDSEVEATITNDGGSSLFTVPTTFKPLVTDLINIKNSTNDVYIGQYMIASVDSATTFNVFGLPYISNETVTITRSTINKTDNNDQILLLVEPDVPWSEFSPDIVSVDIEDDNSAEDPAIAWFYRPMDGNTVDNLYKSLSFDPIPIENAFQRTMIEDYWGDLGPIIQDPVKIYVDAYLPKSVFESITFKQPIRLKTDRFNARFIPNRITGYKNSSSPCTLELIKLP